jgi:hypothetical protein
MHVSLFPRSKIQAGYYIKTNGDEDEEEQERRKKITCKGWISVPSGTSTCKAESAPMAKAVRRVSWALEGPIETARISLAFLASLNLIFFCLFVYVCGSKGTRVSKGMMDRKMESVREKRERKEREQREKRGREQREKERERKREREREKRREEIYRDTGLPNGLFKSNFVKGVHGVLHIGCFDFAANDADFNGCFRK